MFDYEPVDADIRKLMVAELELDIAEEKSYINPFLQEGKGNDYLDLLREALGAGSPESFAAAIAKENLLIEKHTYTKQGKQIEARVPATFNATLAAGEFNRYYMRAVCLLAKQQGTTTVEIYRAKSVSTPRQPTDERIGKRIEPQILLADLRETTFERSSTFGLGAPNSGLSIRIPAE